MPAVEKDELIAEWDNILGALFGGAIPVSAEWTVPAEIVAVLNAVSSRSNHMFYPDGGGLDLLGAQLDTEGNVEWAVDEGGLQSFVHVARPLKLTFWNPGPYGHEANFILEVDALAPVGPEASRGEYVEELTEISVGEYEPLSSWENGYSRNGEPLDGARRVVRTIKAARYAIFGKGSLYNSHRSTNFDAYNAVHNDQVKFTRTVEDMAQVEM
jgi:serine/threonine-protein kinase